MTRDVASNSANGRLEIWRAERLLPPPVPVPLVMDKFFFFFS